MTVTIWHNPRCSKSRQTLQLLEENGVTPDVRLYLSDGPTREEISKVLGYLGLGAAAILRQRDARAAGVDPKADDKTLIAAMVDNPALIERPIVIKGDQAALGRPPEDVLKIL